MNLAELVGLIQDYVQLMVHPLQRVRKYGERLPGGTGLVWVEEQENHVSPLCVPFADVLEVVATVHHRVLAVAIRIAHCGAVDHAR